MLRISPEALVFARVDPSVSIAKDIKNKAQWGQLHLNPASEALNDEGKSEYANWKPYFMQYAEACRVCDNLKPNKNEFHQIGGPISLITNIHRLKGKYMETGKVVITDPDEAGATADLIETDIDFICDTMTVTDCKSYVHGYRIQDQLKLHLKKCFSAQPFAVPAEMIRQYSFPNLPGPNGIDTQINVPMTHVIEAILLFPQHPWERTCFKNPRWQNVQLKFLDQDFPDMMNRTDSHNFYRSQIQANLLDVGFSCTENFENSILLKYGTGDSNKFFTYTDVTNFAFSIPISIPCTNSFFEEGANSAQNTVISLTGKPISESENPYYNISDTNPTTGKQANPEMKNQTAPILVLVSNTFFAFSVNNEGWGECRYETNKSWNQFFAQYYPDVVLEDLDH
jgi:hypothetical protein